MAFGGVLCWFPGHAKVHYKLILVFHCSELFVLSTLFTLGVVSTISILFLRCCHRFLAAHGGFSGGAALVPRSRAGLLQADSGVSSQWIVCSVNIGHVGSGFNHFRHVC